MPEYLARSIPMTDTVITSATKEVVIGFDRPFVIIGERINPTGRKILAAEMAAGHFTGAEVIAIPNDETGISEDPDVRYAVAKKIVERAMDHGIPACDVVVDPLVMPIGAINQAGVQVMRLVHRLRTELKVNTSCGASNISFGLPYRDGINSAFLTMAMGAGMTSAITNPMHVEVIKAVMASDFMLGPPPDCPRWIPPFRDPAPPPPRPPH